MIPGFEKYTEDVTKDEIENIVPLVASGLKNHVGKEQVITNKEMCLALSQPPYHIAIDGPRMRKIIRYIRITGIVMNVVATSKGYYVAKNKQEAEAYVDSLFVRAESIAFLHKTINWQFKNTKWN